jgi:DNA-binding CsgD family transcriptional regulator/tetratricopeptide (TPR) repeat protein
MASRFSSPTFVGRAVELGQLDAARARVAAGPAVVVVGGEAGVGKTRMIDEFARRCRGEGARVLVGGCIELGEEGVPFAPVIQALRTVLRTLEPEVARGWVGHSHSDLARLLPELGAPPAGNGQAAAPELTSAQSRLFELLLDLLERIAAEQPTVLVVEDLHWADRSTRDLLGFLARGLRRPGLLLVLSYRTDELHRRHPLRPFLAELERIGWVERIELGRFDREELTAQLTGILGEPPTADLVDEVFERGQGNAFFTEELVAAAAAGLGEQLPPTLRDTLMARIETLPERTQHVLRVVATAGRQVEHEVLATVAGLPEAELLDALREAISAYVLVADNECEAYAFRHALVREAVYGDLLPGERVRLHAAYATTLTAREAHGGCDQVTTTAELAHHWYAAHDLERALPAAISAGLAAERVYAHAEALRQFERALELWEWAPAVQADLRLDQVDLLGRAAEAAFRLGSADRAVALVRAALKGVDAEAEPLRAGVLTARLANFLRSSGRQGAVALYDEAVRLVSPGPPTPERALVLASFAQALMLKPRFEQARAVCEEAIAAARSTGARAAEGHARDTLGVVLAHLGDTAAGLAHLEEARRIAEDLHEHHGFDIDDMLRAHANLCDLFDLTGELERAATIALDGVDVAREHGLERSFGCWLTADASAVLFKLGRWNEAAEHLSAALPLATSGGLVAINLYQALAALEVGRGELDLAVGHLHGALRLFDKVFVGAQHIGPLYREQAGVAVWQGRHADARSAVAAGLSACLGVDGARYAASLYPVGLRAEADAAEQARARNEEDQAADARRVAVELLDGAHSLVTPWGPEFAAHLATCEAEWTRVVGESDPERWQSAVDAWDKAGQPYPAAYARWRLAEALLVRMDRQEAERALGAAHAVSVRLGARPLRHELEQLARRGRIELDTGPDGRGSSSLAGDAPAGGFGLTRRELEVLHLVADGRTNRQIAEELFISAKTASVHVSNILHKLDVSSRVEAAAVAHRRALVDTAADPTGASAAR